MMSRRKAGKRTTLTKIDPSILIPKPVAVSQHAAQNGARVTMTVNPASQPLVPPLDSLDFNLDPENFNEELAGGTVSEEEFSRGYYVTRVCVLARCCTCRLIFVRTIHSCYGGRNASFSLKSLFDSKARECPLMANANSAATKARTVALIVSRSSSFVEDA